ncbi:unnamed protein product, partial [Rotaria sp. Silwood1]
MELPHLRTVENVYAHIFTSIISHNSEKETNQNECTVGNGDYVEPCYRNSCSWYYSMDTTLVEGKCENIDLHALPMLDLT